MLTRCVRVFATLCVAVAVAISSEASASSPEGKSYYGDVYLYRSGTVYHFPWQDLTFSKGYQVDPYLRSGSFKGTMHGVVQYGTWYYDVEFDEWAIFFDNEWESYAYGISTSYDPQLKGPGARLTDFGDIDGNVLVGGVLRERAPVTTLKRR